MRATKRQTEAIRAYVEVQAHEEVMHLEKAASAQVGPVRHDIWDVHCTDSRWWVITEPTNLYSQEDFKSRDVALTFHIGLAIRVSYLQERKVPVKPESVGLLPGSWRRWEQAFEAYGSGDEAENFQAVGVRLRECLVSFVGETTSGEMVPEGPGATQAGRLQGLDRAARQHAGGRRCERPPALVPQEGVGRDVGLRELADPRKERYPHGCRDRAQDGRAPARCVHRGEATARPGPPAL